MTHQYDFVETVRRILLSKLGTVTQFLEDVLSGTYYVQSTVHTNQFVGRVQMPEGEFEEVLTDIGFERNPLASLKSHAKTGEVEEGSFRYVVNDDMQLHVILYDGDPMPNASTGVVYVYAHKELRWDTHPIGHYRKKQYDAQSGVKMVMDLLDQEGVRYEPVRP